MAHALLLHFAIIDNLNVMLVLALTDFLDQLAECLLDVAVILRRCLEENESTLLLRDISLGFFGAHLPCTLLINFVAKDQEWHRLGVFRLRFSHESRFPGI